MKERVLVTGGSGFLAGHCITQLLGAGYQVRTSVRNLDRTSMLRAVLSPGDAAPQHELAFVKADLNSDSGWVEAVAGCDYVLHVASPFPATVPRDENELIRPAREGTLRVLRASRDAGVRRVVLTSSFAAIGYGHAERAAPFTEADWTNVDAPRTSAYAKSKTLAERAAWDFMAAEGGELELSVINPVAVFGPLLGPEVPTSVGLLKRMLSGAVPGWPRLQFGVVDVRDVAELHLRAMTEPAASGERFLATSGDFLWVRDIALILKRHLGRAAARVSTRELPDGVVRLAGLFSAQARERSADLGKTRNASNEKARRVFGWTPRSADEATIAAAESLLAL